MELTIFQIKQLFEKTLRRELTEIETKELIINHQALLDDIDVRIPINANMTRNTEDILDIKIRNLVALNKPQVVRELFKEHKNEILIRELYYALKIFTANNEVEPQSSEYNYYVKLKKTGHDIYSENTITKLLATVKNNILLDTGEVLGLHIKKYTKDKIIFKIEPYIYSCYSELEETESDLLEDIDKKSILNYLIELQTKIY